MTPWLEFKNKWKDCDKCPLCNTRDKIVLAKGKIPCDVLFVGEAPGVSEDILGIPFVGPAGKLLDDWIETALDIPNSDTLNLPPRMAFTNLVCCIPLGDDGQKTNEPDKKDIKACNPRLVEFIKLCKPQHIVCVGKLAFKHCPRIDGIGYTEIVHPAAVLRAEVGQQGLLIQRSVVILQDLFEELT